MRAVILAAGCGTRLAPMGWDKPKCLLRVGGRTLLDRILASLEAYGIAESVVIVGYRRELVESVVAQSSMKCHVIINHDFAETNTIHSLWLARDYFGEGFLYFNGDVFFDRRILGLLLSRTGSVLAVDTLVCGREEVKVIVDEEFRIFRIGKDLPPDRCYGESVGIVKFARSACPAMADALHRLNADASGRRLFFESALDEILDRQVFQAVPVGDFPAVEIDTPEDYESAKAIWESGNKA